MKVRNLNIQIIRIIAMFSILLCHFKLPYGVDQFFNVGVYVFLLISGYLYGKKIIKDNKKWLKRKFAQICIPVYLWLVVVNILHLIFRSNINYLNNLYYLFNVQILGGGY